MPTLVAGALAVIVLYLLLQMFRAANPAVLARAVKIIGGVLALAVAAFTGIRGELAVAVPLGIFGAGLLGWSPFGTSGFANIAGMFGGLSGQRSSGQRRAFRPDRGRPECRSRPGRIRPAAVARDDPRPRRRERAVT